MRAILSLAHCHGTILGTSWHLVLTTLQHLVWILGLKPASGGSLKVGNASETPNTVITTAVMSELPILSAMLSRLFESSQYLDDVALHHLIDALCKLSTEAMDMAFNNRVILLLSLFLICFVFVCLFVFCLFFLLTHRFGIKIRYTK